MGYTMKGSPAKLGNIQGTSGHRSALKKTYAEAWKSMPTEQRSQYGEGDVGFEKFKTAAGDWWKSEAGQERAKTDPKFKHKIKKVVTKTDQDPVETEVESQDPAETKVETKVESVEPELETYPTRMAEIKEAAPDRAKYGIFTKEGREAIKKRRQAVKSKRARLKGLRKAEESYEKDLKGKLKSGEVTKDQYKTLKSESREMAKKDRVSEDIVRSKRAARRKVKDAEKAKKKEKRAKELEEFKKV